MSKTFLGDEVHELASELQTTRQELELVKMLSERKDGELEIMRRQNAELRLAYEERSAEAVALGTLLEQTATQLSMGIQRYRRQKSTRHEAAPERVEAQLREPETQASPPEPPARPVLRPVVNQPRPGVVNTDIVDDRLPGVSMMDDTYHRRQQ
jgi:chromosome segregation ATPase